MVSCQYAADGDFCFSSEELEKIFVSYDSVCFCDFLFCRCIRRNSGNSQAVSDSGNRVAAVVCRFILRRLWKKKLECSRTATVKLQWQQNTATLKGMVDTGNHLKEPLTGKPVSIIDEKSARKLLGENWEKRKVSF